MPIISVTSISQFLVFNLKIRNPCTCEVTSPNCLLACTQRMFRVLAGYCAIVKYRDAHLPEIMVLGTTILLLALVNTFNGSWLHTENQLTHPTFTTLTYSYK